MKVVTKPRVSKRTTRRIRQIFAREEKTPGNVAIGTTIFPSIKTSCEVTVALRK